MAKSGVTPMNQKRKSSLRHVASNLNFTITNYELLNLAFVHPTFVFENPNLARESNQRLEFLGDAVLGMIIAEHLYKEYPKKPEGELTKIRAALVCEQSLAKRARELNLGYYLLLGRGEEQNGGRERPSILADTYEALIGALYLQVDLTSLSKFIVNQFSINIDQLKESQYGDYKTVIQELVQKELDTNVHYSILEEQGPDHNKKFVAGVYLEKNLLAKGSGRSKKEAEQSAAKIALENNNWFEGFK